MSSENITEDEAALYDRQIRLWGLDAQKRLRAAKVLLIGLKGLGAEVTKNIVLSGIKSLTLLDHTLVDEEDKSSQFLIPHSDLGKNRAVASLERSQCLNPMVNITADTENVQQKSDDYFKQFDVICATCCASSMLTKLDAICCENNIKFFAGDVYGYYGFMFADLGTHSYAEEIPKLNQKLDDKSEEEDIGDGEPAAKKTKKDESETVVIKKEEIFSRLQSALDVDWTTTNNECKVKRTPITHFIVLAILDFMEKNKRKPLIDSRSDDCKDLSEIRKKILEKNKLPDTKLPENFTEYCFSELSPVCAIVGGVLGQEIIKAVSQKDPPHNNYFFYDGVEGTGMVDKIGN